MNKKLENNINQIKNLLNEIKDIEKYKKGIENHNILIKTYIEEYNTFNKINEKLISEKTKQKIKEILMKDFKNSINEKEKEIQNLLKELK